jgi:hypothetical protein
VIGNDGVAAIVLDYRGAARTVACLESLRDQGLEKILLVDNSEDRASSENLDRILSEHRFPDGWIELLRPECNLGFANGVNLAIRTDLASGGRYYYLLLNNDTVAPPKLVEQLKRRLEADAGLVAVAPMIEGGDGLYSSVIWYNRYLGIFTSYRLPFSFPFVSGCCVLMKASAIECGQLFSPVFFMYGEDVELGWRLLKRRLKIAQITELSVQHEGGGSSRKGEFFYEFSMAKAHLQLCRFTSADFEIPIVFLTKFFAMSLRGFIRAVRFRTLVPLKALFRAAIN